MFFSNDANVEKNIETLTIHLQGNFKELWHECNGSIVRMLYFAYLGISIDVLKVLFDFVKEKVNNLYMWKGEVDQAKRCPTWTSEGDYRIIMWSSFEFSYTIQYQIN